MEFIAWGEPQQVTFKESIMSVGKIQSKMFWKDAHSAKLNTS